MKKYAITLSIILFCVITLTAKAQITHRYICHGDTIMLPSGSWYYDSLFTRPVNGNVVQPDTNTTYYHSSSSNGNCVNFTYTGMVQTYTVPAGIDSVTLQVWGAQGGQGGPNNPGGKGGYSEGKMRVFPGDILYVYVGGEGQGSTTAQMLTGLCAGGWNGGGAGNNYMTNTSASNGIRGGGGGASDISLRGIANSATWDDNNHLYSRVIVAGGGGGNLYFSSLSNIYSPGVGGGANGGDGFTTSNVVAGHGGSQTVGGANSGAYNNYSTSSFGTGATAYVGQYTLCGGGGGWYGGGAGNAAGGGSGYIYTAATASNYPPGCLLTSARYLSNATTASGSTTFYAPDSTVETGHSGNGYARIIPNISIPRPPIHVTVLPVYNDTIYDTICAGDSIAFCGTTYRQSGYYPHTMRSFNGCDSIAVLALTVFDSYNISQYDTICEGDTFTYNNHNYTTSGVYIFNYQTIYGCDSIIRINLQVNDTANTHIYDTTYNLTYIFNDSTYTTSGTYPHLLHRYKSGCDSIVFLHLSMEQTRYDTIYDTICNNKSYYFAGNIYTEPGVYYDSNFTIYGCDRITVLMLEKLYVVLPTFLPDMEIEEVCLGTTISRIDVNSETQGNVYRWKWGDGYTNTSGMGERVTHTYTSPGTYNVLCEITAPNGCIDTLFFRIIVYDYSRASFSWDPSIINMPSPDVSFHNLSQPHNPQHNTYLWQIFEDNTSSGTPTEFHDYEPQYQWQMFGDNGGSHLIRLIVFTTYTKIDGSQLVCADTTESSIYITNDFLQFPNVITANGDGYNDIFEIKNLIEGKGFTDTELFIYNSWGRKVYHKKNISTREDFWDPAANNDPTGTYYYRFSGKGYRGNIQRNGAVQVLR